MILSEDKDKIKQLMFLLPQKNREGNQTDVGAVICVFL